MAHPRAVTNQKGVVLIAGCLSLILIFTLLLSSTWIYWFLREKQVTQKLCYKYALEAQKILVNTKESLLDLNKKAWILIIEKRFLQALMKMPQPVIKIAAKVRHKIVVKQQKKLRVRQKSLIKRGNFNSKIKFYELKQKLRDKLQKTANFWQKQSPSIRVKLTWAPVQVTPSFKEIAPPYRVVLSYEKRQTLEVKWTLDWGKLIPKGWQEFVHIGSKWHGSCYSHPHQKEGKWFASIGQGKL